ncbi:sulfatase-like hydrolase/transferase [Catalinimonas alkaloidigena]|uniref:sulfatase-like hydrolase/transferase n=1 Tax=Catalinimonas alkaloidigena TaxID=1075417 RepID=UPI002405916E|nr:sulfatase-like hydrolase/transferase [Catalinimonas alkaloidigena]
MIFSNLAIENTFAQANSEMGNGVNVIYILVDDLGYGDINLELDGIDEFSNPFITTPNLSRFAKESMVFTRHYAAAPTCSPSRAGLLTGKTPTRHNINRWINDLQEDDKFFLRGKEVTIAEVLKQEGYQTAIVGKWHLNGADWTEPDHWTGWTGSFPNQQGFDYAFVSKENPHRTPLLQTNAMQNPGDFYLADDDVTGHAVGVTKGYSTQILTDRAISWISQKRNPDKPFFLLLTYDAVHEKIQNPPAFTALYNTGNVEKNKYYASVTFLDHHIGRLIDYLDQLNEIEKGIVENTVIFFSSDNGPEVRDVYWGAHRSYGTSYPLFGQKRQLYEGGIRVPGMVRWPGTIQPGITQEPNSHVDVLPTLAALTGAELPENIRLDGKSLVPLLVNNKSISREKPLYWQNELAGQEWQIAGKGYDQRYVGPGPIDLPVPKVVTARGSYILRGYTEGREEQFKQPSIFQLYNVDKDPLEKVELSAFEPELYAEMKKELIQMYEDVQKDRVQSGNEILNKVDQR